MLKFSTSILKRPPTYAMKFSTNTQLTDKMRSKAKTAENQYIQNKEKELLSKQTNTYVHTQKTKQITTPNYTAAEKRANAIKLKEKSKHASYQDNNICIIS